MLCVQTFSISRDMLLESLFSEVPFSYFPVVGPFPTLAQAAPGEGCHSLSSPQGELSLPQNPGSLAMKL